MAIKKVQRKSVGKTADIEQKISSYSTKFAMTWRIIVVFLLCVAVFLLFNVGIIAYQLHNNSFSTVCAIVSENDTVSEVFVKQTGLSVDSLLEYERNLSDTDRTKMNEITYKLIQELHFDDVLKKDTSIMKDKIKGVLTDEEYRYLQEQYGIIQTY